MHLCAGGRVLLLQLVLLPLPAALLNLAQGP
jgi:hypothetical protein